MDDFELDNAMEMGPSEPNLELGGVLKEYARVTGEVGPRILGEMVSAPSQEFEKYVSNAQDDSRSYNIEDIYDNTELPNIPEEVERVQ